MKIITNKDDLVTTAVMGEISNAITLYIDMEVGYATTWEGKAKIGLGMGGIKYNVRVGDSCFGWPEADHVEPGVSVINKTSKQEANALSILACIGNEGVMITGEGKGTKGIVTGKHGYIFPPDGHHLLLFFGAENLPKLAIGDKVQIKACGVGLKIEGFEGVKIINCAPRLLEAMLIKEVNGKLEVPVVAEVPAYLMGSGVGGGPSERGNWDIQTSCPEEIKRLGLGKLKIGDMVAIKDALCTWSRGYYRNGITIGAIAYGASDLAGHGPGVNPLLTSKDKKIIPRIDPKANLANILNLK